MEIPKDYLNLLYALDNNIKSIYFSPLLEPLIEPIKAVDTFNEDISSYTAFFENADPSLSKEPLIVEYYKLKFQMKSFEEVVKEIEGEESKEDFFVLNINEFISNGVESDLYLAPYNVGKYFEEDSPRKAMDFFAEARRVALRWSNEEGFELCNKKIAEMEEISGVTCDR